MEIVCGAVVCGLRGGCVEGAIQRGLERGGAGDGKQFCSCVGGEVELVVEEADVGVLFAEAEEARVGAGAEGEDLFWGGSGRGEEAGDEGVDGGGADVGALDGLDVFVRGTGRRGTSVEERQASCGGLRRQERSVRVVEVAQLHAAHPAARRVLVGPAHRIVAHGVAARRGRSWSASSRATSQATATSATKEGLEIGDLVGGRHGLHCRASRYSRALAGRDGTAAGHLTSLNTA